MTDKEIIKALECCKKDDCDNCPNNFGNCYANLSGYSLDLINRLQAEIERLERYNEILTINADTAFQDGLNEAQDLYAEQVKAEIKSKEIKEFAKRLKCGVPQETGVIRCSEIDNLVKEVVGDGNDT